MMRTRPRKSMLRHQGAAKKALVWGGTRGADDALRIRPTLLPCYRIYGVRGATNRTLRSAPYALLDGLSITSTRATPAAAVAPAMYLRLIDPLFALHMTLANQRPNPLLVVL